MAGENTTENENQEVNYLDMSDEDIAKLDGPGAAPEAKEPATKEGGEGDEHGDRGKDPKNDKPGEGTEERPAAGQDGDEGTDADGDEDPNKNKGGKADDKGEGGDKTTDTPADDKTPAGDKKVEKQPEADKDDKGEKKDPKDPPKDQVTAPTIDEKVAAYDRLMQGFKANGREVIPRSMDDAIALMQMGANYNKKMAALKPSLKVLKLLENNELLDEAKLSFLIDVSKKDPAAITKLVKDSGLNPLDLDADKAGEYKPKTHTVDDREIALDTVLQDLEGSPAYTQTLNVVGKQWDEASRRVIAKEPQLIRVIHDHIDSGMYDLIVAEVDRERTFGRLSGMSDIEAYRQVGDAIYKRGGFNHLGKGDGSTQGNPAAKEKVVVTPKPKKDGDDKRDAKRQAATPTKAAAPATKELPADFNPLAVSDEEFAKLSANRFR